MRTPMPGHIACASPQPANTKAPISRDFPDAGGGTRTPDTRILSDHWHFDADPMVLTSGLHLQAVREHRGDRTRVVEVDCGAELDAGKRVALDEAACRLARPSVDGTGNREMVGDARA
jgi:hypothetical protein